MKLISVKIYEGNTKEVTGTEEDNLIGAGSGSGVSGAGAGKWSG